ncbi:FAD linked oxidase [Stappia sp. 22II-S9-Z10]|nr:FAD linked oxidase [Stappia sp. 22II-S9-Z10]
MSDRALSRAAADTSSVAEGRAAPAPRREGEAARFQPWGLPGPGDASRAVPAARFPLPGLALPFGAGRSYGDSCTLADGPLLDARPGARIHHFDPSTGLVVADAGVSLGALMAHVAPRFMLPVVPGTQFATLGGAIANDIHGKNHHRRGSFGAHVEALTLRRSDGYRYELAPGEPLFAATVGGMGMTGIIERAAVRLMPVASQAVRQTTVRLSGLADYFARAEEADAAHEYAVAWIDSLATGERLGRGHLITGDHAKGEAPGGRTRRRLTVPVTPPVSLLNRLTLGAFNALYHARVPRGGETKVVPASSFFFPLDAVGHWNRLYGPRGLHQHQSVLPHADAHEAVREMLRLAHHHGHASFLTVLKRLGANQSPAIISFARPGVTLTLDFPDKGPATLALLDALDRVTLQAGGAINPYKDRRMSATAFDQSMPDWRLVEAVRDPHIVSDFWRRTALALSRSEADAA